MAVKFVMGDPSKDGIISKNGFLYNSDPFLSLKQGCERVRFAMVDESNSTTLAAIIFFIVENRAISGFQSPFGSFELNRSIKLEHLDQFIDFILKSVTEMAVTDIIIKSPAVCYDSSEVSLISFLLLQNNFEISENTINHHLSLSKSFEGELHLMERRKLQKSKSLELVFGLESKDALREVYDFVENCRLEKNQSISMTFKEIKEVIMVMPESYFLFTVRDQGNIVAACISIDAGKGIMYNFYPASSKASDAFSPMVFLLEGIHTFCKKNQFRILDLGTSMLDDQAQYGIRLNSKNI